MYNNCSRAAYIGIEKACKWCATEQQSSERETHVVTLSIRLPTPREDEHETRRAQCFDDNNRAATNTVDIARTATHYNTHIGCKA